MRAGRPRSLYEIVCLSVRIDDEGVVGLLLVISVDNHPP